MLKLRKTNLVPILKNREFETFAHGCNCFCTMGAGIAKDVKRIFPEVYALDCSTVRGDIGKLGTIGICDIGDGKIVINAYTQFDFRSITPDADYRAISQCFQKIGDAMIERGLTRLTIPRIGAGLAGGDWNVIEKIIEREMPEKIEITAYYL